MQDDPSLTMLTFASEGQAPIDLTPEEDEALALSETAAARGEFAIGEEVRAIWAKHGL